MLKFLFNFVYLVTLNWEYLKKDTIFNWEYDPISAIK